MQRFVIVLAAGKGTRMKSTLPKVLHKVGGKPMVQLVVDTVKNAGVDKTVTVVGNGADQVKETLGDSSEFAVQTQQLGTGHAIQMAAPLLASEQGVTLIASGDAPMFTTTTYEDLFSYHEQSNNAVTVLTAKAPDPTGYGRIIRDEQGNVLRIVEQKDANDEEAAKKTARQLKDRQFQLSTAEQVGAKLSQSISKVFSSINTGINNYLDKYSTYMSA